jgi:hypothetical protein
MIFFKSKIENLKKSVPLQKIVDFGALFQWLHIKRQQVTLL